MNASIQPLISLGAAQATHATEVVQVLIFELLEWELDLGRRLTIYLQTTGHSIGIVNVPGVRITGTLVP
jgi:hypothetical protein